MRLEDGDIVLAAFAQPVPGSDRRNGPVLVLVMEQSGVYRLDCLQMEEQSPRVAALYEVSAAAHRAMTEAVEAALKETGK